MKQYKKFTLHPTMKRLFDHPVFPYTIIIIVASLLFIPFLGNVHLFDWDEINFAESAREMIVTGDYNTVRIDYEPFWEKPPLFILMQVVSMKMFGVNEFAARFPNAICGIFTLLFLFFIGNKLFDKRFGALWALSYAGSILPFFYFKSGIIDPWFNLFIFAGIYFSTRFLAENAEARNKMKAHVFIACAAAAIGLAILTKGPVALLLWGITAFVYAIYKKFRLPIHWYHIVEFFFVLLLVGGSWFIGQILVGNKHVVMDFIDYQIRLFQTKDAGHGGFLLYHFSILLFGVFPASFFSLSAYKKTMGDSDAQKDFKAWMIVLLWVVLVVFTIVKTKIIHYSSLCYFPLTFLGAYVLYNYCYRNIRLKKWIHVSIVAVAALFAIVIAALTNISMYKDYIIEKKLVSDAFTLGNLQADAGWNGYEWLVALAPLAVAVFAVYFYRNKKPRSYCVSVLAGVCLFIELTMTIIVKRVEAYSQRAAIEFFDSKKNENCYIITLECVSYGQYFYAQSQQSMNHAIHYLQNGEETSLPIYVMIRNKNKEKVLNQYPQLEMLYEKNGYMFLKYAQFYKP